MGERAALLTIGERQLALALPSPNRQLYELTWAVKLLMVTVRTSSFILGADWG